MDFNPFNKKVNELSLSDLDVLKTRGIAEGFYVEYKSEFTEKNKIASTIAAFANTRGGWYFIGVKTGKNNVPSSFPGFSIKKTPNPIETVRNIARDRIDPTPDYEDQYIETKQDYAIILIRVPESFNTPHICSDGWVYHRVKESTERIKSSETLNLLYEKKRQGSLKETLCLEIEQNIEITVELEKAISKLYEAGHFARKGSYPRTYLTPLKTSAYLMGTNTGLLLDMKQDIVPLTETYKTINEINMLLRALEEENSSVITNLYPESIPGGYSPAAIIRDRLNPLRTSLSSLQAQLLCSNREVNP